MNPFDLMNYMLDGIKKRNTDDEFIAIMKQNKESSITLLNISLSTVAIAGLDILKIEPYKGEDRRILEAIKAFA